MRMIDQCYITVQPLIDAFMKDRTEFVHYTQKMRQLRSSEKQKRDRILRVITREHPAKHSSSNIQQTHPPFNHLISFRMRKNWIELPATSVFPWDLSSERARNSWDRGSNHSTRSSSKSSKQTWLCSGRWRRSSAQSTHSKRSS